MINDSNKERRQTIKDIVSEIVDNLDIDPDETAAEKAKLTLVGVKMYDALKNKDISERLRIILHKIDSNIEAKLDVIASMMAVTISDPSKRKEYIELLGKFAENSGAKIHTGSKFAGDNIVDGDQHIGDNND